LAGLITIYRQAANTSQRMKVCTMLAAEMKNLPDEIQLEMRHLINSGLKRTSRLNPPQLF
jgi:hypothetical protein